MSEKLLERLKTLIELDRSNLVSTNDEDGREYWTRKKESPRFLGNNKKEYSFHNISKYLLQVQ